MRLNQFPGRSRVSSMLVRERVYWKKGGRKHRSLDGQRFGNSLCDHAALLRMGFVALDAGVVS